MKERDIGRYIGHPQQLAGVTEVTLARGKGKGMTLLEVRNGLGLAVTLSADRCLDPATVSYRGDNMGYFSPSGYVAPSYYDGVGSGFLKSFTAGFMTTCGLSAVGSPCEDMGECLPLHGNISNTPAEAFRYSESDDEIKVEGEIRDASIFGRSYLLRRSYTFSKRENSILLRDEVTNIGAGISPCMLLYHINLGYPLLSEAAKLVIPHNAVTPRDAHAAEGLADRCKIEEPTAGYVERCYYYDVRETGRVAAVGLYNPELGRGVKISYDKAALPCFIEWKMMGVGEYVLGLEPGNCTADGRDRMRERGMLLELAPGESYQTKLKIEFTDQMGDIECLQH